jgi:outer membrane protein TolC
MNLRTSVVLAALVAAAWSGGPARAQTAPQTPPQPGARESIDALLERLVGRPGGLTSDVVAEGATRTSWEVRARADDLAAAEGQVDAASAAYLPRVKLSAGYTRLSHVDPANLGGMLLATSLDDNTSFEGQVQVPVSDYLLRLAQAHAAATRARDSAELTRKATALGVAANARIAYWSWVRARLQIVIAERALAQVREHLADAQHGFDAGTATRADVLRVESQVAQDELLLQRARDAERLAQEQLRTTMHDPGATPYEIGERLDAPAPASAPAPATAPAAPPGLDELYREAIAHRLEIAALDLSRESLLEQVKVARAAALPRLDVVGDVLEANPNSRFFPVKQEWNLTWAVGVTLSWTISDVPGALAQVRTARARAAGTEAQRGSVIDGLTAEVRQAFLAGEEALVALDATARSLRAAEESFRVRQELFRNGHATSTELTDAETELTRARLEALDARIDLRVARVRLDHALGRDAR